MKTVSENRAYLIRSTGDLRGEAVLVLLRVPGIGMLVQRRAVDSALEILETDLAFDRFCGGVLILISEKPSACAGKQGVRISAERWGPSWSCPRRVHASAVLWLRYPS